MVNNEENGHGIYASGHLTIVSTEAIADVVTRTPYVTDPIATDTERRITIYGKRICQKERQKVVLPFLRRRRERESGADVSTTMNIYAHSTREAKRSSARLLDKVVGGD